MQQSNAIVGTLIIAYVVFITQRGELGTYLTLLRGGGQQPSAAAGSGANNKSGGGLFDSIGNLFKNPADLVKSFALGLNSNPSGQAVVNSAQGGSSGNIPSINGPLLPPAPPGPNYFSSN